MSFTLTLLGTDTVYTPFPDKDYVKGETLSFISSLIAGEELSSPSVNQVQKIDKTSAALIDGPTTLGSEVGDRITRGVLAILKAIERGETQINVIAHSRGAVEAILVAHEVQRIQTLYAEKQASVDTIVSGSSAPKEMRTEPLKSEFGGLNLDKIGESITQVSFSIFNIDPVPGGRYRGAPSHWYDARFYSIPSIVKEYEQYIYENERSRCFKPIIPVAASPDTKFTLLSMPGHHGTGSGNFKDQQAGDIPADKGNAEHVQQVFILKIIDFLQRNQVKFQSVENLSHNTMSTQLLELINPLLASLQANNVQYNKLQKDKLLNLYDQIVANRNAYNHFNTTSYAYLGQDQDIQRLFSYIITTLDQRLVHNQKHDNTYLEQVLPPIKSTQLLNFEHARLALQKLINIDSDESVVNIITNSMNYLLGICRHPDSVDKNIPDENLVFEGLNMLIEHVGQLFLHDKIQQGEERSELFGTIERVFNDFAELGDSILAKKTYEHLQQGMFTTLEQKESVILNQYNELTQVQSTNLPIEILIQQLPQFIAELDKKNNKDNFITFKSILTNFQTRLLQKPSVEELKLIVAEVGSQFEVLRDDNNSSSEIKEYIEIIGQEITQLVVSVQHPTVDFFQGIIKNHGQLAEFKNNLNDLKPFISNHLTVDEIKEKNRIFSEKQAYLIENAALFIIAHNVNMNDEVKAIFTGYESLYQQIVALSLGLQGVEVIATSELDTVNEKTQQIKNEHQAQLDKLINDNAKVIQLKDEEILRLAGQATNLTNHLGSSNEKSAPTILIEKLLTDSAEIQCNYLINTKLMQYSQNYLQHLFKQLEKIEPLFKITDNDVDETLKRVQLLTLENAPQLKNKINNVAMLFALLTDIEATPLPSQRVTHFYQHLNQFAEDITLHRDPAWQRYLTNMVVAIGVVLSGVLPGLIGLMIFSKVNDKSPKYWQSEGKTFFNKCREEISEQANLVNEKVSLAN